MAKVNRINKMTKIGRLCVTSSDRITTLTIIFVSTTGLKTIVSLHCQNIQVAIQAMEIYVVLTQWYRRYPTQVNTVHLLAKSLQTPLLIQLFWILTREGKRRSSPNWQGRRIHPKGCVGRVGRRPSRAGEIGERGVPLGASRAIVKEGRAL